MVSALLSPDQQQLLISQARTAEQLAGQPLDMEWAIDRQGQLHWVQARPITTLASELLTAAAERECTQLDEKLYLELFAPPESDRPRRASRARRSR
mgnify:CR=1 FL=1